MPTVTEPSACPYIIGLEVGLEVGPDVGLEVGPEVGLEGERWAEVVVSAFIGGEMVAIQSAVDIAMVIRRRARRGVQCAMSSSVCSGDGLHSRLHSTISIKLPFMDCSPRVLVLLLVID